MNLPSFRDSLAPEVVERVNQICDRFEAALQAGASPRIEDYLCDVPEAGSTFLLHELLILEWTYGTQQPWDEYPARFPQFQEMIRALLQEWMASAAIPVGAKKASETLPSPVGSLTATDAGKRATTHSVPEQTTASLPSVPGYEILEMLGRGAMGVVYKARHLKLKRIVALKMILAGAHADRAELDRFATEAEAVARLRHPNIVQIHEIGEHNGLPYFTLEFCEGGSLNKKLDGTPLEPREAAQLVETLARAMQAAHDKNIIHRDLKPGNILLSPVPPGEGAGVRVGEPIISDFGLAKKLDDAGQTHSGAIMGTPSYMAPEQASGKTKEIGPLADVYALGAILYELLTGRPPFRAATVPDTLVQVVSNEPVPPSQLQPSTPRDLETICLKCLRKELPRRYGNALELAKDLCRFREGKPILARPAGNLERTWRWCERNRVVASLIASTAVTLVIGTIVAWVLALEARKSANVAEMKTTDARHQKGIADGQKFLAEKRAKELSEALVKVSAAEQKAKEERDNTDEKLAYSNYLVAQAEWKEGNSLRARHFLNAIPTKYRLWEWKYHRRVIEGSFLTLYGHLGHVNSVAFSPDGQRVVSGGKDNTVRVWDARGGPALVILRGHTDEVTSVAFSADGERIVSGSLDRSVKVWDPRGGPALSTLKGHIGDVMSVAFSPDGQRIVSGGGSFYSPLGGEVKVWDSHGGPALSTLQGHTGGVASVAFSPDGQHVLSGGGAMHRPGQVKVWKARGGPALATLQAHTAGVASVAFSPDGQRVVSGGRAFVDMPGEVKVWGARGGLALFILPGHTAGVASVAFSADGQRIVSGSHDQTVKLWDLRCGPALTVLRGHTNDVVSVAFSPDSKWIVSASRDKTARVWDVGGGPPLAILQGHTKGVASVAFSPDGRRIVSGGDDKMVKVWDARGGPALASLEGHTDEVNSVAFSHDGQRIVSGSCDKTVRVWDARGGPALASLEGHTDFVRSVAFSANGQRIVSGSHDTTVKIWDPEGGPALATLPGHIGGVASVAFSPDGQRVVSGGLNDKALALWDTRGGPALVILRGHTNGVATVTFSQDGQRIVSGSYDGTVKVWDARGGPPLASLEGHTGSVASVAFSLDGQRIVSGSHDKTARVWDVRGGAVLATLQGHTGEVASVTFSPDSQQLVSASHDKTARVWHVSGGQLAALQGHVGIVTSAVFSPDCQQIVSGSHDRTVKVWDARGGPARATLQGHTMGVIGVAFSPDGQRVVGQDLSLKVLTWDVAAGARLNVKPPSIVTSEAVAALSPDGVRLALGQADGDILLIENKPLDASALAANEIRGRIDPFWQDEQAKNHEKEKNWYALAFHLRKLMEAKSQDHDEAGVWQRFQAAWKQVPDKAAAQQLLHGFRKRPDDTVPPALLQQIELAEGFVTDQFAIWHSMPVQDYLQIIEQLRPFGYRPIRCRPFLSADRIRVAGLLTRDWHDWQVSVEVSEAVARQHDTDYRAKGYEPVDVAGYLSAAKIQYSLLWVKRRPNDNSLVQMYAGIPDRQHARMWQPLIAQGFLPWTYHRCVDADGQVLNSLIWRKPNPGVTAWQFWHAMSQAFYESLLHKGQLQQEVTITSNPQLFMDLSDWLLAADAGACAAIPWYALYQVSQQPVTAHPERLYSAVFHTNSQFSSTEVHGLTPAEHLRRCKQLSDAGYRPVAISVAEVIDRHLTAASVWHR